MGSDIRKGMPSPQLDRATFYRRFLSHFYDPEFDRLRPELEQIAEVAWKAYEGGRKAPRTRAAGEEYDDPAYQLSIEWLETHNAVRSAQERHSDRSAPSRILLINASPRSE